MTKHEFRWEKGRKGIRAPYCVWWALSAALGKSFFEAIGVKGEKGKAWEEESSVGAKEKSAFIPVNSAMLNKGIGAILRKG